MYMEKDQPTLHIVSTFEFFCKGSNNPFSRIELELYFEKSQVTLPVIDDNNIDN